GQASAASPSVAALLLMTPSASLVRMANRGGGPVPPCQARSPSRQSPVAASAVRSPVPIAPQSGTGGGKARGTAAARAGSSGGAPPRPPGPRRGGRGPRPPPGRPGRRQPPAG